jgi:gliding motility-associated protein GldL
MKKNKKSTFFESKIYKEITAKVYGIGASIVIIGCLFKILHLPGAAMMLGSGLIIEALIFLISAFEPLHKEVDWARVYPELEDDIEQEDIPASPVLHRNSGTMTFNDHAMPQLSEEQFESLKNSILKMGETADQMAVLSDITMASSNLAQQIESASQTTMTFNKAVANDLLKHKQYIEEVDKVADELESLQKGYKLLSEEVNHSVKETSSSISKLNKSVEVI